MSTSIKFDVAKGKELQTKIMDLYNKAESAFNSAKDNYAALLNVMGGNETEIGQVINNYIGSMDNVVGDLQTLLLGDLTEFLEHTIREYSTIDTTAVEGLDEVDSILKELEG